MQLENFANFVFLENINNLKVHLELGGVLHNKDLFFFLFDLFCKGLALTFGGEKRTVELNSLSEENIEVIKMKMALAGIKVTVIFDPEINEVVTSNIIDIEAGEDNLPLESYIYKLQTKTCNYMILFKIVSIYK